MRILITGGCGFIGSAIARFLYRQPQSNDEIFLVDTMQRHGTKSMNAFDSNQIKVIEADLADPDSYQQFPSPIDRLYHLAAIVGVGPVESDPIKVMKTNTLSTMYVLDWFSNNSSKDARFLFSSSSEVYSGAGMVGIELPIPTHEDVPVIIPDVQHPRFSYALTKMWGEAYSSFFSKNIFTTSVRYHNVYGPGMGYDHVIPQVISRILDQENPFKIIAGDQTRAFCWIEDAAKATYLTMESTEIKSGATVHIGNENEEIEIKDLYNLMFDICQWKPQKTTIISAPEASVQRRCPDTTLLKRLTNYTPKTPLKDGLTKTINWYTKQKK
jgi:nucleoside-diphosphate-sugar epimerase